MTRYILICSIYHNDMDTYYGPWDDLTVAQGALHRANQACDYSHFLRPLLWIDEE